MGYDCHLVDKDFCAPTSKIFLILYVTKSWSWEDYSNKKNKEFSLIKHIKCIKLLFSTFTIKDGLRETLNCEFECH